MKFEVNISKKSALVIIASIFLFTSVLFVYAYGGNNPSQTGHSLGEIGMYSGKATVAWPDGQPESNKALVTLPTICTNMRVFVNSPLSSIFCYSPPCGGSTSEDVHAYTNNVQQQSFEVFLSSSYPAAGGGNGYPVYWLAVCD